MKNKNLKKKPFFQENEGEALLICALLIVLLIFLIYYDFAY